MPLRPAYDLTTDPYVTRKREAAAANEAAALEAAAAEFREWETAKSPAKLLREWGKGKRPTA